MRAYAGKKKRATKKAREKKKVEAEAEKKRRARARARKPAKKASAKKASAKKASAKKASAKKAGAKKAGAKAPSLSRKPRNQASKRQSRTGQKSTGGAKRPKPSARKPVKGVTKRSQATAHPVRKLDWKAAEKLLSEKSGYQKPLKPLKRKSKSKLDPRTKRRRQNKALVKRVDRLEEKRQRNRRTSLSKRAKRKTAKEIAQEKKRIEKLRLKREQERLRRKARGAKVHTFADAMGENFLDLLTEAIATGQTPKAYPNKRKMDKYEGVQSYLIVRRLIIPQNVQEIMYAVRQKLTSPAFSGLKYPVWLASIHFASMGENLLGYGGRILRSEKAGADMFTTQANDSTGIWSSRIGMLDALEALLDKYAGEGMNVVFLYHIRLMNYDPDRLRPR